MKGNKIPTLCWNCKYATGGCAWADEFEPVNGWTAQETVVLLSRNGLTEQSFYVISCPEFIRDAYMGGSERCNALAMGV